MGKQIHFLIQPASGTPIYRQLVDQIYALVAGGQLQPGDMLPSVREVARTVSINPMTVSKAYTRLELEGLVQRVRGRGMRVAPLQAEATAVDRKQQFHILVQPAIHRARQLGLSDKQIRDVVDRLLQELP